MPSLSQQCFSTALPPDPFARIEIRHIPSFSFRFQQGQDVVNLDGALDVSDDGSRSVVHEFNSDLGDTTSGTGSAQNLR